MVFNPETELLRLLNFNKQMIAKYKEMEEKLTDDGCGGPDSKDIRYATWDIAKQISDTKKIIKSIEGKIKRMEAKQ